MKDHPSPMFLQLLPKTEEVVLRSQTHMIDPDAYRVICSDTDFGVRSRYGANEETQKLEGTRYEDIIHRGVHPWSIDHRGHFYFSWADPYSSYDDRPPTRSTHIHDSYRKALHEFYTLVL